MNENENFEVLDAFLQILKKKLEQSRVQILDATRFKEFESAYNALSEITPDAEIVYDMHELNDGSGYIQIETNELIFYDIPRFCKAIEKADNFEIYPLTTGKIQMAVTFNGVMKEV